MSCYHRALGDRDERPGALRAPFPRAVGAAAWDPVVTRDRVRYAKPDPDLFLTAADRIGADIMTAWSSGTA
jgi:hypothetical protein